MPALGLDSYVTSLASHRLLLYSIFSLGAVLAVILNALKNYSNFYSVTVHLSRSNGATVVLANFGILIALLVGRVLQHVFFGPLRSMEIERLYDRMWFFLTESLLAFTIFRDEFGIPFALMFGLLLFTKCFHWLLSDRIEWMDQRPYPGPPLLFHLRTNALMAILWVTDCVAFVLVIEYMVANGVGGAVLFASEYAILLASLVNSAAKYAISMIELRRASQRGGENAPPWEDKSMWVFYVELATDFLKLVTYLTFFLLVLAFYGLPLNIVRDVYITARSFIMRVRDLMRYRTATRNMDQRYPNATVEDMNAMSDCTCIICREEMVLPDAPGSQPAPNGSVEQHTGRDGPNTTPKKLPCGHVFHFYCLRSWLERQQSCPTCRRSVLDTNAQGPGTARQQPAPPQPGAVPQNPALAPNIPNGQPAPPPDGQQVDNAGGLLGRFMGMAGIPPMVPGQIFGNPPQLRQPGAVPQAGIWHPPAQDPYNHAFQGFQGPGGVWQPWPLAENEAPAEAPTPTVHTPVQSARTPTEAEPSHESPEPTPPSADVLAPAEGSTTVSNPKEAAALAALRRTSSQGSSSATPSGNGSASSRTDKRRSDDSVTESTSSSGTAGPSRAQGDPSSSARSKSVLPHLVPLYNPAPPLQAPNPPGVFPDFASPRPIPLSARVYRSAQSGSAQPGRAPNGQAFSANGATRVRRPLRDLPPTLTDDQLARLDGLTRDAIDERLRILEDIQRVSWRCAEELLRVRSVLPRSTVRTPPNGNGMSAATEAPLPPQPSDATDSPLETPTEVEATELPANTA